MTTSKSNYKLINVFGISNKVPSTYVSRPYVDKKFLNALEKQKHIVVYGCSKQGKTSLRKKYLEPHEYVAIQCTNATTREMIYELLLKEAGATTSVTQTESSAGTKKLGIKFSGEGNLFFTKAKGETEGSFARSHEESRTEKYLEIDPSDPNDVIRALKMTGFKKWIVIEDYHYLSNEMQESFAADLKAFYEKTDHLRMIVVGVWLQPGKLTRLNGDLEGRVEYINADRWEEKELAKVLMKGEKLLNISFSDQTKEKMVFFSQHNVGLLQQIAERICEKVGISKTQSKELAIFDDSETVRYRKPKEIDNPNNKNEEVPLHLASRSAKDNLPQRQDELNFTGGPIDRWLADLGQKKEYRYANFLRDFANGPREYTGNTFRWIAYAIVNATDQELHSGLSLEKICTHVHEVQKKKGLGGDYKLQRQDIRFALHEVRSLHRELQVQPPILDYDATEDVLRVVDSGFLLYHFMKSPQSMLIAIGLDP